MLGLKLSQFIKRGPMVDNVVDNATGTGRHVHDDVNGNIFRVTGHLCG